MVSAKYIAFKALNLPSHNVGTTYASENIRLGREHHGKDLVYPGSADDAEHYSSHAVLAYLSEHKLGNH